MANRKGLYTYYAELRPAGRSGVYQGGNVLPPNMDTEPYAEIRCPDNRAEKLTGAVCRVLTNDQFGRDTLLFHGTCHPDAVPFPNAEDHDNLRWYAFEPNMSLDFIKEEAAIRAKKGLPVGPPTMYVYKATRPIRNLLLFADPKKWTGLGGHEYLLRNNVCGVKVDIKSAQGSFLKKRAEELGCPLPEYAMAVRAQTFKILRGTRGEACHGWVRLNSVGMLENKLFPKTGFELALTHENHSEFLELIQTFTVKDDAERYGSVATETTPMDELEWHLANLPFPPPAPPLPKRRMSDIMGTVPYHDTGERRQSL